MTATLYGIDDAHGNKITTGLGAGIVWRTAQRIAADRGQPVYVYEIESDDPYGIDEHDARTSVEVSP